MIQLKKWQKEAFIEWIKFKHKGIVQACTGSGKTYLGLKVIETNKGLHKILVVVPTVALMDQWEQKIKDELDIDCGIIGNGRYVSTNVDVAVINSIRLEEVKYGVVILDECHHYLSEVNFNLFKNNFKKILGLSATVERHDGLSYDNKLGIDIVFRYEQDEAIKNGDLSKYIVYNVGIDLMESERVLYNSNDITIKRLMPMFNNDINLIFGGQWSPEKTAIRRAITKRRGIISNAKNKLIKAIELIQENKDQKIIVFTEYIKTIKELEKKLEKLQISVCVYHSSMKASEKAASVKNFKLGRCSVLLSAKALDEGLDVPDCDVGIIVAGTSTKRQTIQRVGRILRKGKQTAKLYQIYAKNTKDSDWVRMRSKGLKGYEKAIDI